jgi:hypothetical protein
MGMDCNVADGAGRCRIHRSRLSYGIRDESHLGPERA